MPLNEELDWSQVGDISTGSGKVRNAFQSAFGDPSKELLSVGMSLYKFNNYSTLSPGEVTDDTELSPWWSPTQAFKHDAGLTQRLSIAEKNGVSFREWGRLTSVIKEDWSSMAFLLTIEIKEPVYAWFGGFKGMSRLDDKHKSKRDKALENAGASRNLPGGGTQFYIPNLKVMHIRKYAFKPI
jgi:hypothetical protein